MIGKDWVAYSPSDFIFPNRYLGNLALPPGNRSATYPVKPASIWREKSARANTRELLGGSWSTEWSIALGVIA